MSGQTERERARQRAADGVATREEVCCANDYWPAGNPGPDAYLAGGTHGTRYKYRIGCRCDLCRTAVAEYARARRRKAKA